MESKLTRVYRFKFYLNGGHSILIGGHQGQVHPHTWEFSLKILLQKQEFVEFNVYEKEINQFFGRYQNQTLNNVEPFDAVMPTLENMVEFFGEQLRMLIRAVGGELMEIEGSETPTRSYLISYEGDSIYLDNTTRFSGESVSRIMDRMLDQIERTN